MRRNHEEQGSQAERPSKTMHAGFSTALLTPTGTGVYCL
jgi:hypothetical protein